jgi:DNA-binding NarL/FixJ family response regulator
MQPADAAAPVRVLVVDADDRVRESLAGLLGIGDRVEVVGSAGGPERALEIALAERPDVVVIDPRLPEMDRGLAFITRLRAEAPEVRIVAMGWADGPEPRAAAAGIDGWVRKTFRPADLIAAILSAFHGPTAPRSTTVL